jgi:hypothetical protein
LKIPPCLPFPSGPEALSGQRPKGGDVSFPLWKRGIEGDFMAILLISLAFEIHFSKG